MPIHKPCIAWNISSNSNVITNLPFSLNLPNGESQASSAMNSLASNTVPLQTTLVSVQFQRRVLTVHFLLLDASCCLSIYFREDLPLFCCNNTWYTGTIALLLRPTGTQVRISKCVSSNKEL